MRKEVTIRELIEASEKNGFKWAQANNPFRETDESCATFSCVVGQGMANLKHNARSTGPKTDYIFPDTRSIDNSFVIGKAFEDIYTYNDTKAKSFEDALAYMKERLAPYLDEKVYI